MTNHEGKGRSAEHSRPKIQDSSWHSTVEINPYSDLESWALDLQSWEERDWRLDLALQAGLRFDSLGRVWRLGVQYTDGRVPLGEFFQYTEAALAVGLWLEI